jgi:hypothetical protein
MGENRSADYYPDYSAHRDMIIFLVKVFGQKQFQSGVQIIVTNFI